MPMFLDADDKKEIMKGVLMHKLKLQGVSSEAAQHAILQKVQL